jgi:hypothetical protein
MAGNVRRITGVSKRANSVVDGNAGDNDGNDQHTSVAADGLSDVAVFDLGAVSEGYGESDNVIDIEAPYGRKADGTPRKRRGRQSGTASAAGQSSRPAKAKKGALGVEGLSSILANLTLMLAAASKTPEAALSNEETTLIADAVENVAQYYDFSVNSKAVAWANLAVTTGGIIGSHVIAYKMRMEKERNRAA